ncbi:MAG: PQQ-binding-like beta-propeller repeat protein [Opitutaceae bacterium]|nr:PQQ-binding-like beta-propeller repeat protein [Opitutaceae bacterium]
MKRLLLSFTLLLSAAALHAENWSNWRGPAHNGSSSEKNLPASFTKTEGVKWAVELPGASAATPVIWGDRVFATAADAKNGQQAALCLDRRTGKQLWRADISEFTTDGQYSNSCSPSPVTDGKVVVFFFGTGDLVAFDVAGKKLWARNLGPFAFQWTFSTSPLLHDGRLIMQVLQRDVAVRGRGKPTGNESFLLAIDPATGKDLWRHVRPSDAVAESREAFSTPLPFEHNGRKELVVVGGDAISGHDPANGRELWRWGTWNPTRIGHWRLVPSPATDGNVILACGPKNAPVYAVKAGGSGGLTHKALAWQSHVQPTEDTAEAAPTKNERDLTADVPTPLLYEGKFYILNGTKKKLYCINPADGAVVWSGDLGGRSVFQASPTAADGKIYVMNFDAEVFVIQAGGAEFKLLHQASFKDAGDDTRHRSSIAISQGNLFVRTGTKLFCLGK